MQSVSTNLDSGDHGTVGVPWKTLLRILLFLSALYIFFASIDLMSTAFKLAGKGFAEQLLRTTSDPIAGLIIGVLATSLVQSSSSTTSIVVGLAASGSLPLRLAVPIIMGANIGTTVTNTIVSLGHVTRRHEFERAFAASTVHDFFNILAVIVILPIEINFHPIEITASALQQAFTGAGGIHMVSPLKQAITPLTSLVAGAIPHTLPLLVIALLALFGSLMQMVRVMRRAVMPRVETMFKRVLFRNDLSSFCLGTVLTATVQSSSASTSLVVPLAGTGVLSVREIFPYTLGANLGTTITAILASFATENPIAITVALSHLTFNVFGILLLYPFKAVPIWLAQKGGAIAARSGGTTVLILIVYVALYIIPILYLVL